MMSRVSRVSLLILPVGLVLMTAGAALKSSRVTVQKDSFLQLQPATWSLKTTGVGPTALAAQGRLEMAFPSNSSGKTIMARVEHQTRITGDFDARVEYQILEWPTANGVKFSLGTEEGSIQRASDPAQGGEVYLTHFEADGVSSRIPTSEMTGALRLVRRGKRLTGYALRSGAWVPVHSAPLAARTPVRLHLAAWSHDSVFAGKPVRVAFDNFALRTPSQRRK